jgi:hypothetical protein
MLQPLDVSNLLEEEAEEHLVRVLEKGRARAAPSDKVWDASVEGERPPLRWVTKEGAVMFSPPLQNERSGPVAQKGFRKLAKHFFAMKSQGRLDIDQSEMMRQLQKEPGRGQELRLTMSLLVSVAKKVRLVSRSSRLSTPTVIAFSALLWP